jgi:hypothetical protein
MDPITKTNIARRTFLRSGLSGLGLFGLGSLM